MLEYDPVHKFGLKRGGPTQALTVYESLKIISANF